MAKKKIIIILSIIFIISALAGFGIYKYVQNNNVAQELQQQQQAMASYDVSRFECSNAHMWENIINESASDANHDNLKLTAKGTLEVGKPVDIEFKSEAGDWKQNSHITARICVSKTSPAVDKTITIPNWSDRREIMTNVLSGIVPEGDCITGALFSNDPSLHMFSPPLFDYYKLCGVKKPSGTPTPTPTRSATASPTASPSRSPSSTPRYTPSPTPTRTATVSPTASPTASPTGTPPVGGPSNTPTPSPTPTDTPAPSSSATSTPAPSSSASSTPVVAQSSSTPTPDRVVADATTLPQAGVNDGVMYAIIAAVSLLVSGVFALMKKKYY